jgi:hypothetical protein
LLRRSSGVGHHFAALRMMKAGCCGRIVACKPGYAAFPPCSRPLASIRYIQQVANAQSAVETTI